MLIIDTVRTAHPSTLIPPECQTLTLGLPFCPPYLDSSQAAKQNGRKLYKGIIIPHFLVHIHSVNIHLASTISGQFLAATDIAISRTDKILRTLQE